MRAVKSLLIAFSTYSQIPVPRFAWKEEDLKYVYCFFPWVGAVTGAAVYCWQLLCGAWQVGSLCRVAVSAAIPLLITGGFHVDGFMDTVDAIHSFQPRERRLEILKDSHIGAFAVILLALYGLIWLGAFSEIRDGRWMKVVCCGFFLSRCLCGISAVSFPPARQDGMLRRFADGARKRIVLVSLLLQGAACVGLMLYWFLPAGLSVTAAALLSLVYYFYHSRKAFGGVTGDTAGYFVLVCEGWMLAAAAGCGILLG